MFLHSRMQWCLAIRKSQFHSITSVFVVHNNNDGSTEIKGYGVNIDVRKANIYTCGTEELLRYQGTRSNILNLVLFFPRHIIGNELNDQQKSVKSCDGNVGNAKIIMQSMY